MFIRQYVNPKMDWWGYITSIPNDGNDYEVIFEGGEYTIPSPPFPLPDDTGEVDHSYGGSITLKAHIKHDPVISVPIGDVYSLYFLCDTFHMDGLRFESYPYFAGGDTFQNRGLIILAGGWAPTAGLGPSPSKLFFTNNHFEGAAIRFTGLVSMDRHYYTQCYAEGNTYNELSGTSLLFKGSLGSGYAHIHVHNESSYGINGPDRWYDWPSSPGAVKFSSHTGGTQWLEVSDIRGESTVHISECRHLGEIRGSHNHDMHALRFMRLLDERVRIDVKDCKLQGYWSEGNVGRPGVNGITHLVYNHFTSTTDYDVLGVRPVLNFENVLFESRVGVNVRTDEFVTRGERAPFRDLFWTNESASYEFWDCTFRWIFENQLFNNEYVSAIHETSDNIDTATHNCTFEVGNGQTYWPRGRINTVYTDDTDTRGYKDENWLRVYPNTIPERVNILGDGNFEGGVSLF